jgi:hypothetical protein
MLILFVILTALSLLLLIGGVIWTLMRSGETRRQSGTDVGAEIVAERMYHGEFAKPQAQEAHFEGKAVKVEKETSLGLADIKRQVQAGQWGPILPVLMALAGFVGVLVFGALIAWVAIDNKLIGGLFVVAVSYALVRIVLAFARA